MLFIEYIIEFIKMYIVTLGILNFSKCKSLKKINLVIIFLMIIFDFVRIIHYGEIIEHHYDTYIVGILVIMVMLYAVASLKLIPALISIYFSISFIDMLVAFSVIAGLSVDINDIIVNPLYNNMLNILNIVLFLFVSYIIKYINLNIKMDSMNWKEVCLIIISIVGFGFYVASFQIIGKSMIHGKLLILGVSVGGLAIMALVISYIIKNNNLGYMEDIQMMQEKLLQQQKSYYENLQQREIDTRKFRHDINEHLNCMAYLIKTKNHDELLEYMDNLTTSFNEIEVQGDINTGHDLINIVISDLLSKYDTSNIKLEWVGLISEEIKINNKDICGLFSNLLKNAFEAAENSEKEKFVEVNTIIEDNDLYIMVKNSYNGKLITDGNQLLTNKKDKKKHGYGTKIIQDIVRRYNGQINFLNEEDIFIMEITFLNIID